MDSSALPNCRRVGWCGGGVVNDVVMGFGVVDGGVMGFGVVG